MKLSYQMAREIAEKEAEKMLRHFATPEMGELLRSDYIEAENFWIFFQRPDIEVPQGAKLWSDGATAISTSGAIMFIPDLTSSPEKMQQLIVKLSEFFGRKS